ncbi:helix-turn-helix domain-containing protein [Nocardioides houyundeii]|uniref:helix-turn-helix domain-containing protein n=1 Tax=Nocardioides houyundeii TaxID=2045452 RepID=UPI0018EF4DCA|nr:helix-turn-helix transcriptional regulator [Nocardioides houyundeii]
MRTNIEHFRLELGLSYAEVSRELARRGHKIPPLGLRRIEAGERRVDVDDLVALALVLDVNPSALLFPRELGSSVGCALTGYPESWLDTRMVWQWGNGLRSLTQRMSSEAGRRFHERVRPREVLNDEERFDRRKTWTRVKLLEWEEQCAGWSDEDRKDGKGESEYHNADIEQLRTLDPDDDEGWARQAFDPAPPLPPQVPRG